MKVWCNSFVKPSGPGLLFVGSFFITHSISLLVTGLFIFSISSFFSLGRLYASKSLSVSSRLSFYCSIIVHSYLSYNPLYSVVLVVTSLSFLILFIWALPLFFLLSHTYVLSVINFAYLFTNQLLVSLTKNLGFTVSEIGVITMLWKSYWLLCLW